MPAIAVLAIAPLLAFNKKLEAFVPKARNGRVSVGVRIHPDFVADTDYSDKQRVLDILAAEEVLVKAGYPADQVNLSLGFTSRNNNQGQDQQQRSVRISYLTLWVGEQNTAQTNSTKEITEIKNSVASLADTMKNFMAAMGVKTPEATKPVVEEKAKKEPVL